MRDAAGVDVQLGGGIRTRTSLEEVLEVATRAVIGSLAVGEPELVASWLTEFGPDRLTLALDVRVDADGTPMIATHGWTRASTLTPGGRHRSLRGRRSASTCCARTSGATALWRAQHRRCTPTASRAGPRIEFQASGGVRDVADLEALAAAGVTATVSGKALLEGRLKPEEIRPFLRGA